MPKGNAFFVPGKKESGSSPVSWANVAELAKERTLCAFFLLCDPLTLIPQTPPSGAEHMLSGDISCVVVRKHCII